MDYHYFNSKLHSYICVSCIFPVCPANNSHTCLAVHTCRKQTVITALMYWWLDMISGPVQCCLINHIYTFTDWNQLQTFKKHQRFDSVHPIIITITFNHIILLKFRNSTIKKTLAFHWMLCKGKYVATQGMKSRRCHGDAHHWFWRFKVKL